VERNDVRVLQIRRRLDLLQKTLGADGGGEVGAEYLERDRAIVTQVGGEIDNGHAAGTESTFDAVAFRECRGEARGETGVVTVHGANYMRRRGRGRT